MSYSHHQGQKRRHADEADERNVARRTHDDARHVRGGPPPHRRGYEDRGHEQFRQEGSRGEAGQRSFNHDRRPVEQRGIPSTRDGRHARLAEAHRGNHRSEREPSINGKHDLQSSESSSNDRKERPKSALKAEPEPDYEYELELQSDEHLSKLAEERRRRRQAILEKHSATATPIDSVASGSTSALPGASVADTNSDRGLSPARRASRSASPEAGPQRDADFSLTKEARGNEAERAAAGAANSHADVSAADYDPNSDRALDDRREGRPGHQAQAGIHSSENDYTDVEVDDEDDVDDMFDLDDAPKQKRFIRVKRGEKAAASKAPVIAANALADNWDDPDGYYRIVLGEKIGEDGRYHVFATLGQGMFSAVVRARDTKNGDREVAIKVIRSQETMYKAGLKEIQILNKLAASDPEDKKHIVRLLAHFEHRGHLCMVFESLSMNLREVVKRFGKDVGLNLRAVRTYAYQMFLALAHMKKTGIMHADIKPDNILINDGKTQLKICDLGSAADVSEMEITPYLVSRFYRAPEIILGQPYDPSLDVWSIGCTLYELYTGKILFPGRSNNQMLLLIQELRGRFTQKQLRKARFAGQHFDEGSTFLSVEKDKSTGADIIRQITSSKFPTEDLRARLLPGDTSKRLRDDELRLVTSFIDLLNKTLELDPAKRIPPKEALSHGFFSAA